MKIRIGLRLRVVLAVVMVMVISAPVYAQWCPAPITGTSKSAGPFVEAGYRHLQMDLEQEPIDDFSTNISGYNVRLSGINFQSEAEVNEPVIRAGYRNTSANGWSVYGQFSLRDTEISGPISGNWAYSYYGYSYSWSTPYLYSQSGTFSGNICLEADNQPVLGVGASKSFVLGQTGGSLVVGAYYNRHFSQDLDGSLNLTVLGVSGSIPLEGEMELSGYDYGARAGLMWTMDVDGIKLTPSIGAVYSKAVFTVEDSQEETDFEQDGNISGFASLGLETARGLTFSLAGTTGGEQSVMAMAGYTF